MTIGGSDVALHSIDCLVAGILAGRGEAVLVDDRGFQLGRPGRGGRRGAGARQSGRVGDGDDFTGPITG